MARYDGVLSAIPNAHVLLSPLTTQEAVLSSRIEGTQATMGEVLTYEASGTTDEPSTAKEADIWEILNYRKAMRSATQRILNPLKTEGILREFVPGSGRHAATLGYPELLNIAEGRDAF